MRIVIDIETNSLNNPTKIWLIVCKDIDTGKYYTWRNVTDEETSKDQFLLFAKGVDTWIAHNWLGYDYNCLSNLINLSVGNLIASSIDTLIISKLVDYSRKEGHSIEAYGEEFNLPKGKFNDWTKWSQEMEDYCVRDVDICELIYRRYLGIISDPSWSSSIELEHTFQITVNSLHRNGFSFNSRRATNLLNKVTDELKVLDTEIEHAFPPRLRLLREINPRRTQHGTLNRNDFRWHEDSDLSEFTGDPFCLCRWERFNPSSHKQIITVLTEAGWSPSDKTQTHIDIERECNRLKYRQRDQELDTTLKDLYIKLDNLKKTGWKINENNLSTLPSTAPAPSRLLAKRILLESRRRTLTEWLNLVSPDGRIRGRFYGIGAWTHRMAHQKPNTANIPTEVKLYGKEMRSLWQAPKKRLLVGVDAEGIQLRIFAHYIDDKEFTDALVRGRKEDKTDPHNLNQRILGDVCKSRNDAKRFIYALLLGAGSWKLSQILGCSDTEAKEALGRLINRYIGWKFLKETTIPNDARRGYFIGLDGRKVPILGSTIGERKHLSMSGYLQNGEAVIIKMTTAQTIDKLLKDKTDAILVDIVHDEVIFEVPNDVYLAEHVNKTFCDTIVEVGQQLNLKCPLAGDGHIGLNWSEIH